ncbi:hypothetical protein CAEBREN_01423 [Caenorhabditis brenneri]|uniref:Serpentine receptor class gamma n=1 Tax=Caenorhabditis brenneri TaxID=135651 RepID=G0MUI1_CAEBE|nr:hypothetical protein CAEBREN_01423 [Caenorhabditis brenneri]
MDILYHVESTIPYMIWVNDNFHFLFHFYVFFANYFYNAQCMSVIVMSVHRLWSCSSTTANEFWKTYYPWVYLTVVVASASLAYVHLALKLYNVDYYDHEIGAFVIDPIDQDKENISNIIFLTKSIIYFLTLLIINIWTVYLVHKRFSRVVYPNINTRVLMRNLTTISFINSFIFFVIMLWPMGLFVNMGDNGSFYYVMVTSDMLSLSLPYILMAFDKNVQATLTKSFAWIINFERSMLTDRHISLT